MEQHSPAAESQVRQPGTLHRAEDPAVVKTKYRPPGAGAHRAVTTSRLHWGERYSQSRGQKESDTNGLLSELLTGLTVGVDAMCAPDSLHRVTLNEVTFPRVYKHLREATR